MSFSTALSGLNAATADLNVKSNNIANVNTTGFKNSRAEFADVFAVSAFGTTSNTAIGNGVVLRNVSQQFAQGNLEFTENALDLAISGEGFFALAPELGSGEIIYTRAGEFGVNKDGYVVNNQGWYLRTFPVDAEGNISATTMNATQPLQLPPAVGAPESTTDLRIATNLPSNATGIDDGAGNVLTIDPSDPTTYNHSTSATIYDSLGNEHVITYYYQKIDPDADDGGGPVGFNQWQVAAYISADDIFDNAGVNGRVLLGESRLSFTTQGALDSVDPPLELNFSPPTTQFQSGAAVQDVNVSFAGTTQNSGPFNVGALTVNGFPTGRLTGVDVSDDGLIRATYSNGQAVPIGKIALGNFANPQALNKIGNTSWKETTDSGPVIAGEAGTGSFGEVKAGALETSNVDLTKELVGLITAQRNFQANSKAIETNNAITQTIINLR
ncbi:flagellar hook protein FlgE [Methylophaga lonarensis MPL]|uniref:Flagellar hook protein FlgE n=1 Tax=Methylophaga lonarensis MPL TaxID=1286106 RepID=M7P454_9GAMM|nr:flagellar hook protein FlgE [Methylophaga lonarensis]EMR14297.1 flagellar hook protein FlgE [Methylophaga lonarensis MPL]